MVDYRELPPTAAECLRLADQWDKAGTGESYPRRGIDPQIIALADHLDATENALAAAWFSMQGMNELKREYAFAPTAEKKNAVRAELHCAMRSALETVSVLFQIMDDYESKYSLVRINAPDVGAAFHKWRGHYPELQGEEWKGYDYYPVVTAIILNDLDIDLRTALQRCEWFKEDWRGYIRDFGFPA
jgi:hypothetical protein